MTAPNCPHPSLKGNPPCGLFDGSCYRPHTGEPDYLRVPVRCMKMPPVDKPRTVDSMWFGEGHIDVDEAGRFTYVYPDGTGDYTSDLMTATEVADLVAFLTKPPAWPAPDPLLDAFTRLYGQSIAAAVNYLTTT